MSRTFFVLAGLWLLLFAGAVRAAEPTDDARLSVDLAPGLVVAGSPYRFGRIASFALSGSAGYEVIRFRGEHVLFALGPRVVGRWLAHGHGFDRPTGGGAADLQGELCWRFSADGRLCGTGGAGLHVTKILLATAIGPVRFDTAGLDAFAGARVIGKTWGARIDLLWLALDTPVEDVGAFGAQFAITARF